MTAEANPPIRLVGIARNGVPEFEAELRIPPPADGFDTSSSERQIAAVTDLFGEIGALTASQASIILTARDYGRQCAKRLFARYPTAVRDQMAVVIAVRILADQDWLRDVCAWGTRRFNTSPDGSAIARTKRFAEVRDWLAVIMKGSPYPPQ